MNNIDDFKSISILVISGHISESKRQEFEQTYRLASGTITKNCLFHNMSKELEMDGQFYFVSFWQSESDIQRFKESVEYQLLNGSFHALGSVDLLVTGNLSDIKVSP